MFENRALVVPSAVIERMTVSPLNLIEALLESQVSSSRLRVD